MTEIYKAFFLALSVALVYFSIHAIKVGNVFSKLKEEYRKAERGEETKHTLHETTLALIECSADVIISFAVVAMLGFEFIDCLLRVIGG